MKKYLLLCMIFLCGCASQNNTQIQETTAVESITETTTQSTTVEAVTETTTEKKKNFLIYSVTENKVDLKLNKKVVQTIELDYCPIRNYISAEDFDFDGYTDIFIPAEHSGITGTYYRYNPDTEHFDEWDELNKIGYKLTINSDNTLTNTSYLECGETNTKYQWNGDSLERITLLERYLTYRNIIEDFYEYQPDGSKILVERIYINSENNAKYKTLGRDEVIYFEVTENSVNAMRDGKILQSFENNTIYNHSLSGERHTPPEKYLDTSDFDYDGYEDLFIPETADKGTYYHFNPDTERFDVWDELNKTGDTFFMESDDENYLRNMVYYKDGTYEYETLVREWRNGKLVPHHRETTYKKDKIIYRDYVDTDDIIFRRDRNYQKISVDDVDFDFDGYNDLYIPDYDDEKGTYYRYNPDKEKFGGWDELNKISLPLKVDGKYLKYHTSDLKCNAQTILYEWKDDKLVQYQREVTYNTDDGERYTDYFNSADEIFRRERTIFNEYRITAGKEKISVDDVDFDFDGYNDLYIPDYDGVNGIYYHYNPDMEHFDEWDELNKIGKLLTVGMSENITIGKVLFFDTDDGQRFIYKWNNDKLNLIERRETDENNNMKLYYIDENGNETLIDESGG